MFEHFDSNTRIVIDAALSESRDLGHNHLGTEHLLIALTRHAILLPEGVRPFLPTTDTLLGLLANVMGPPPRRDADLLKVVGVDLDEVRTAVRRTFGDAAIERLGRRRVHQPWQPWRQPSRRCTSLLAGSMTVAPRVKQAVERAQRSADHHRIGPAQLLAGMIEVEDALSNRLLRDAGIDPVDLRRHLIEAAG